MSAHPPKTRVRIRPGSHWPAGATGVVSGDLEIPLPAEVVHWPDGARVVPTTHGPERYYFVWFDSPQDDGSGDGPYRGGEIAESELEVIAEPDAS